MLNKMLVSNDVVTELVPNLFKKYRYLFLSGLLVALLSYVGFSSNTRSTNCLIALPAFTQSLSQCIEIERVKSNHDLSVGLSKYDAIPENQAMLFVFDTETTACMWMKDMKFAIDIVWLNHSAEVIKIAKNIPPDSYPETFCADQPARYVIELSAGVVDKTEIHIGQKLSI